ncbi:MAG: RNA polymerase sigma factor [Acidobacteria bacterium]|nr:RNA polymerase sigma factor [Acidobacteriota bacterium]
MNETVPTDVSAEWSDDADFEDLLHAAFRYAMALTHAVEEAEDLVHDACVAVVRSGGSWDKAYLLTTIRNRFIDRYRRNRRILFVPIEEDADLPAVSLKEQDYLLSGALDQALGELRAEERETLFLAVVEGYTAQEIADLTRRPRGTVLSLLHRTKSKLRTLLNCRTGAEGSI